MVGHRWCGSSVALVCRNPILPENCRCPPQSRPPAGAIGGARPGGFALPSYTTTRDTTLAAVWGASLWPSNPMRMVSSSQTCISTDTIGRNKMKIRRRIFWAIRLSILPVLVTALFVFPTSVKALEGKTCSQCNSSCLAFCESIKKGDPDRYPRCLNDCTSRMSACKSFSTYLNCIPKK